MRMNNEFEECAPALIAKDKCMGGAELYWTKKTATKERQDRHPS